MYLRRRCSTCNTIGPVGTARNGLDGDDVVYWTSDPFAEEIHGDDTPDWYCGRCLYQSAMDI
jgi:hypothetical protein